jgi:Ca-activated chloride channel homolog
MSFEYLDWWPLLLSAFTIFVIYRVVYERRFFSWVNRYWFFSRSRLSSFSTFLYLIAFGLLMLSLLDLRGVGITVKRNIPDQRTILLLDLSASMLVEDIRPNRIDRAIFLARHFVKESVGHQIAILVFSDNTKMLLPFTTDIDLIDSRLRALGELKSAKGGSNLQMALREAIQLLSISSDSKTRLFGNILIIGDLEIDGRLNPPEIPPGVAIAIIGVGSRNGGKIPIRDKSGILRGYKKSRGEFVISKLSEQPILDWAKQSAAVQYWHGATEELPTKLVHHHFRQNHQTGLKSRSIQERPVYSTYLAAFAICLLIVSSILRMRRSFALNLLLIVGITGIIVPHLMASDDIEQLLRRVRQGDSSRAERLSIATMLVQTERLQEGITLFEESVKEPFSEDVEILFNLGSAYLKSGNMQDGAKVYHLLHGRVDLALKKQMTQNMLLAISKRVKLKQEKKGKKSKSESGDKQKNKQRNSGGNGSSGEKKERKKEKSGRARPAESNGEQNGKKSRQRKTPGKMISRNLKEREDNIRRKRKLTSVPALIKQVMGTDHQLQRKYIDTSGQKGKKIDGNSRRMDW